MLTDIFSRHFCEISWNWLQEPARLKYIPPHIKCEENHHQLMNYNRLMRRISQKATYFFYFAIKNQHIDQILLELYMEAIQLKPSLNLCKKIKCKQNNTNETQSTSIKSKLMSMWFVPIYEKYIAIKNTGYKMRHWGARLTANSPITIRKWWNQFTLQFRKGIVSSKAEGCIPYKSVAEAECHE